MACSRRARLVREPVAAPVEEVGVGAPAAPSHAAAQLVELGKPERVGAVDDDRVRVRDVEPGLDDRGADEDVGLAAGEGPHHRLEGALRHLAVADDDPRGGQEAAQLVGLGLDRLDPVVDEEDLPATVQLAQDRVLDEARRRLGDPGLDRQPVLRWRLDHRQVADPDEGQVERPRDRRRRERQDVDLGAELLEALLGGDAEALLLVDDEQAEVAEADVLREEPMRPDHDVHGARPRGRPASPPAPSPERPARAGGRWPGRPRSAGRTSARAGRPGRWSARGPPPAGRPGSP